MSAKEKMPNHAAKSLSKSGDLTYTDPAECAGTDGSDQPVLSSSDQSHSHLKVAGERRFAFRSSPGTALNLLSHPSGDYYSGSSHRVIASPSLIKRDCVNHLHLATVISLIPYFLTPPSLQLLN
jgi:hypothetical protein